MTIASDLLNSLTKRIGHVVFCTDAFNAMAEVCAAERERGGGRTGGASGAGGGAAGTVLMLIEPASLIGAGELVMEIRLYAPATLVWKYQSSANPRLAAVVEGDVSSWASLPIRNVGMIEPSPRTPAGEMQASRPTPGPTRLKLSGESDMPQPSGPRPQSPEIVVRPQPAARSNGSGASHGSGGPSHLTLRGGGAASPEEGFGVPTRSRSVLSAEELRMLLSDDPIEPMSNELNGKQAHEGDDPRSTKR